MCMSGRWISNIYGVGTGLLSCPDAADLALVTGVTKCIITHHGDSSDGLIDLFALVGNQRLEVALSAMARSIPSGEDARQRATRLTLSSSRSEEHTSELQSRRDLV